MWGMIMALSAGALMSVQGVFNTQVTQRAGLWVSAGFVQRTALGVCLIAWLLSGRAPIAGLWEVTPKYLLLGGVIGAFITALVVGAIGSLGPAKGALLIVTAQTLAAYLIELLGLFGTERAGFAWHKLLGLLLAVGGIVIFKS